MTRNQRDALRFIQRYAVDNDGVMPSLQEVADAIGLKSKSGAHRLVSALVEADFLAKRPNRARAIKVLQQPIGDER